MNRPTIHIRHGNHEYPTHENRTRPFFNETYIPPDVSNSDSHEIELPERQSNPTSPIDNTLTSSDPITSNHDSPQSNRINIPQLINQVDTSDQSPFAKRASNNGSIDSEKIDTFDLDDLMTLITSVETVKLKNLSGTDLVAMESAMAEEIKYLFDNEVIKKIKLSSVPSECEIQILKWVLQIKRNLREIHKIRHRARLVSASNLSALRHSLAGNAPTIAIRTIRLLLSIAAIWNKKLKAKGDSIVIRIRDVTKAYLQAIKNKRMIVYRPPKEAEEDDDIVWLAIRQIYGEVEAGRYWFHTFVPWIKENVLDLVSSMYDPSLLYSPSKHACMALCTDDILSICLLYTSPSPRDA